MKNTNLLVVAIVALSLGALAGFFGGLSYQKSQTPRNTFQFSQNRQLAGTRFGQNGIRPVAGEILSVDPDSVTVKLPDGGSKIVLLTNKTTINKSATGSAEDLKTGVKVSAFGTENSDGSITAQNVQIGTGLGVRLPISGQK